MEENLEYIISKYPYLEKKCNEAIILPCDKLKEIIKTSEKVEINEKLIYSDLVKYIISNDNCYERVLNHFNTSSDSLEITSISYGDTTNTVRYTKTELIQVIEFLFNIGQLSDDIVTKYSDLLKSVNYEKLKTMSEIVPFKIDGQNINISSSHIFSLYELSDDKYLALLNDEKVTHINDVKKEHFIYAAITLFDNLRILDNYLLPDYIINRYESQVRSEIVDIEALGEFKVIKDTLYKKITIDNELENEILKGIPSDYNDIEKAIHIYIKMCKLFTYDEEYYVKSYKGEFISKHRKLDYVKEINLSNNRVVCYEFNIIYAKLLNDLNIIFESDYQHLLGETYGYSHVFLRFRYDKFLIKADSVKGVIGGDIAKVKINQQITGLECYNANNKTKEQFQKMVTKVYNNLNSSNFNSLVDEYTKLTDNIKPISFEEKLLIVKKKLEAIDLIGVDAMTYAVDLFKIVFTSEENEEYIKLTIIKNNEEYDSGNLLEAVIAVNESGFSNNEMLTKYYIFKPKDELIEIDKEFLEASLNYKRYGYLGENIVRIPGISTESKGGQR